MSGYAHVRSGSKADLTAPKSNFRFTPESGLKSDIGPCPKSANNGQADGRSDAEHALVCEQSGCSAGMDENNICVGLPSHLPNKRDQTSQSLARVDWVNGQGFERSGKLDGLD